MTYSLFARDVGFDEHTGLLMDTRLASRVISGLCPSAIIDHA